MAGKPATVRVLHRAVDSDDEGSGRNSQTASPQYTMKELKAANESLKQRLEQAKASASSDKKRLADELRLERAGRERAEELLVRQAKELEACAAAKARLEEAFSRSMSELRYTRAEHAESKQTIQQLLRELMLLRDAISRSQGSAGGRANNGPGITANGSAGGSGRATDGGSPTAAAAAAAASSNKQMSKGQLLTELQATRARMAEEQSKRMEAEAEKERAEESQEMISRETAKLLNDRAALLSDLSSKDDVVREMQGACDHLQHQLSIALNDRNLLLEQLRTLAGDSAAPALAALTAAMSTGFSQDLDELEAFALGDYNGELHGALQEVCSPRGERRLSEGLGVDAQHLLDAASSHSHGQAAH